MFTIAGLGNPGEEYVTTRHNVGWIILEAIIAESNLPSPSKSSAYSGLLSEGVFCNADVGILFPTTFMNNSGTAVMKYVKAHGSLESLVVVHDEIDLPFGDIRISYERGAGGHNGVKSIIDACGSMKFIRVRVGIAQKGFFGGVKRPVGERLADYVLGSFKSGEIKLMPEVTKKVAHALELIVTKGKEVAMQEVNNK